MSTFLSLLGETPATPKKSLSPLRILTVLVILIFAAEMVSMMVVYDIETPSYLVTSLLDGLIMVVLILPSLYFLQLRPLLKEINERTRMESALRQSEKLLWKVLELLPVGVLITDKEGKIVHGNPASHRIWSGLKYVGAEQYGEYKGWWPDTGMRVAPEEWAVNRAIHQGETVLNEEIEIESFDGMRKAILNSAVPILSEAKSIQGVVIVNQDITNRKQAEQELAKSEALFKTAFKVLPVGAWITDENGNIIFGNPAGHEIWAGAKYVGIEKFGEYKAWWLNTGERITADDWAVTRAIKKGETSLNEEIEIECFDGTHKIILNSAIPVSDDHGQIYGVFVVNQDITQIRQKEQELIQTNELMEKYFLSIDTNIAYLDREFNFIRVNDTYANKAGHPAEFFIGKNHFELYPHAENQTIFQNVLDTGQPYSVLEKPFEYPEYPQRGVTYWDWSLHPVKGLEGQVEGLVLSLVDVTERKQAELKLERQNEQLRELSIIERENREFAESLVQATIAVNQSLELDQVLMTILEQIRQTIAFQGAGIILIEAGILRLASYLGFEDYPEGLHALEQTTSFEEYPFLRQVCSSSQPLTISSTNEYTYMMPLPGLEWINSVLAAPLKIGQDVIGVIGLISERPAAFGEQETTRLMAFTAPAALAIYNAQLFHAELTARQVSETLRSAVQALSQTLNLDQVIHTLLEHLQWVIPADAAGVTLLGDETRAEIRVLRGYGHWAESADVPSFPVDGITDSVIHRMISSRKSLQVPGLEIQRYQADRQHAQEITYWMLAPMLVNEKIIGYVEIGLAGESAFNPEHVHWIEALVSQAGVALQNAWLFEQVRSHSERLQALARKLVDIQENERHHIARELHDEAGQAISSMKLSLGRMERDPECPESMRQRLVDLKGVADGVLEELHRLAMDLRPAALDHLGLIPALEQSANKLSSRQLSIQFRAMGFEDERLSPRLETSLYRVVQEALTNTIRYAEASNIGILLERKAGMVRVFVEDNGIGFNPEDVQTDEHVGLVGMRERAEMLGGSLTIESTPGRGTSIILEVPDVDSHSDRG
jgi:PAS domain S-box-containing protein